MNKTTEKYHIMSLNEEISIVVSLLTFR